MKKVFYLPLVLLAFTFFACGDDDDMNFIGGAEDSENTEEVIEDDSEETPEEDEEEIEYEIISDEVTNLYAPSTSNPGEAGAGPFVKFDFDTGAITDSETDWDIAFRSTTIAINGGVDTGTAEEPVRNGEAKAAIASGLFSEITSAEGLDFSQDSADGFAITTGPGNGWYNYDFFTHIISPIPGTVLVFKTRNGNYAKIEITSYYIDGATTDYILENPEIGANFSYYNFNYVYNTEVGNTSFE